MVEVMMSVPVGEWGSVRICAVLYEKEKRKEEQEWVTSQESESVRWYLCGGEVSGVSGHMWKQLKI